MSISSTVTHEQGVSTGSHRPGRRSGHVKRMDIQGLRALSVAMVVLFHLRATLLPGGYIGVDVFFVISGFLITGQMLREVSATGRLRILEFWARRVRRLLPAAFLVLMLSALAIIFLFPQTAWSQNLSEIAFAAIYVVNFRLAFNSVDYLARDNHPSVAQHYWSLSVEEQFYIVVPLLIVVAVWLAKRNSRFKHRQILAAVLVLVAMSSFIYSIYDTQVSRASAYFVTTTRAWEFALGGLVALAPPPPKGLWRNFASWLAFITIVACALLFNDQTVFPGAIAAIPVCAGGFLLWVGDSKDLWAPQFLSHNRFVQIVGDASYSIYLWHWPLIVVYSQLWGAPGWLAMLGLTVLMLLLSVVTKYYVEDPIRRAPGFLKRQLPTFSLMFLGVFLIGCLCVIPVYTVKQHAEQRIQKIDSLLETNRSCLGADAVLSNCENPYDWKDTVDPISTLEENLLTWPVPAECEGKQEAGWPEYRCRFGSQATSTSIAESAAPKRVILIGDSHAWHFYPGLAEAAKEKGWDLSAYIRMACSPFLRGEESSSDAHHRRCSIFNEQVESELLSQEGDATVIVAFRADPASVMGSNSEGQIERYTQTAREYIHKLNQSGKKVYVVRTVPGMPYANPREKAPECIAAHSGQNDPCTRKRENPIWLMDAVAPTSATLLDPGEIICADGNCHTVIGGLIVYSDDNHLSRSFSLSMKNWWEERIK